ncbi:MAG: dihydroorotase family protein [Nitrososphaerota archaeon]|nr:dihydroorotase family protein [Aigarchaeota archaeon]MDW8076718.1 dihydroorotase family protein [Nitrososphaerota archaeon]
MADLRIIGRAFVNGMILDEVTVEIDGERISSVSVGESGSGPRLLIGRGQILLPSATDLHVHLRDWKQAYKEDVFTGTSAAVAGGVTTVAEMPNTSPPIKSPEVLRERLRLLAARAIADYSVHVGALEKVEDAKRALELGACGMKLYPADLERFEDYLRVSRESGMRLVVHAEIRGGDEVEAVKMLLPHIGPNDDVRFAHVSRAESLKMIEMVRGELGAKMTVEATPHHLLLSEEELDENAKRISAVRPPLASMIDKQYVFSGLCRCSVDFIASDHAPHTLEEKFSEQRAAGFPGLEIMYPLMLTEWLEGRLDISTLVKKLCKAPAEYLGIPKGEIKKGFYADLVIFDIRTQWSVSAKNFLSKAKYTPFEGRRLSARVSSVFRRGELVYEGELMVKGGGAHVHELKQR